LLFSETWLNTLNQNDLSRRFVEGLKGFVSSHPGHNAGRWSQDQKTPVAYAGAVVIALLAVFSIRSRPTFS